MMSARQKKPSAKARENEINDALGKTITESGDSIEGLAQMFNKLFQQNEAMIQQLKVAMQQNDSLAEQVKTLAEQVALIQLHMQQTPQDYQGLRQEPRRFLHTPTSQRLPLPADREPDQPYRLGIQASNTTRPPTVRSIRRASKTAGETK